MNGIPLILCSSSPEILRSKYQNFYVKMLNNEETMSFPHYFVVNQCNVDGFEWISKPIELHFVIIFGN